MSYRKPGFYEVPTGKLVPEWADTIRKASPSGWNADLASTIAGPKGLGRGGRRVADLTIEDVLAMEGEGSLVRGSPAFAALQQLLLRFLHHLGIVDVIPAVIGYKSSPMLNMDEAVDSMMSSHIRWPDMNMLGGEQGFKLEALKGVFPTIVRGLASLKQLRPVTVARLRLKLGAIAYKVAMGMPIDQAERSFWVLYSDPYARHGYTDAEWKAQYIPTVNVAENSDPLVNETWELFRASTEAGPFLRFCTLLSNMSFENLVYWLGPQMTSLSYGLGYIFEFGNFWRPDVRESIVLPWARDDQMRAARERHVALRLKDKVEVLGLQSPIQAYSRSHPTVEPILDMPAVEYFVDIEQLSPMMQEASYYSDWRERVVTSRQGANADTMVRDLALMHERAGESQLGELSLLTWPLIDLNTSKEFLKRQTAFKPDFLTTVWIPGIKSRSLAEEKVDMRDYYVRMGSTVFPPAFREAVLAPLDWLYVVDTPAEEFIAARLGLTAEQKKQAAMHIRVSHNWGNLNRLLEPEQLPLNRAQVFKLLSALAGY